MSSSSTNQPPPQRKTSANDNDDDGHDSGGDGPSAAPRQETGSRARRGSEPEYEDLVALRLLVRAAEARGKKWLALVEAYKKEIDVRLENPEAEPEAGPAEYKGKGVDHRVPEVPPNFRKRVLCYVPI